MNSYFLTLVLKSELDEKARGGILDVVKGQIELKNQELWGNRDLTYPIKKQSKGYYAHFEFEADPAKISQLDKGLKLEEDVLRYLLIRR